MERVIIPTSFQIFGYRRSLCGSDGSGDIFLDLKPLRKCFGLPNTDLNSQLKIRGLVVWKSFK